jgi:hypothetical protein
MHEVRNFSHGSSHEVYMVISALKVEEVLRIIGCPPERLSATAANCVKLISSLALTLGLGDCEMQR